MVDSRLTIAKNIARYFKDGDFINLGIGIPLMSANYVPEGMTVILHAEGGFAGQDGAIRPDYYKTKDPEERVRLYADPKLGDIENGYKIGHRDLVDAGGNLAILSKEGACFDIITSFTIARGSHLDATVLGGMQVDEEANLANWVVPGGKMTGMGGAMDLVAGAKKVIVSMEHCSKNGDPKILKKCTFPLTAVKCVDVVVTDKCIIEFIDGKMTVVAMVPGMTKDELQAITEAKLYFADKIDVMDIIEK